MRLWTGWPAREGNYVGAQHHDLPRTKADLAVATDEYQPCQQQRSRWAPDTAASLRGSATIWRQAGHTGLLPSRKGTHPVLTGTDKYSGYGWISFPACNIFAKTTISGFISSRYHTHSSDQESNFTANTMWPWVHAHWIHRSRVTTLITQWWSPDNGPATFNSSRSPSSWGS